MPALRRATTALPRYVDPAATSSFGVNSHLTIPRTLCNSFPHVSGSIAELIDATSFRRHLCKPRTLLRNLVAAYSSPSNFPREESGFPSQPQVGACSVKPSSKRAAGLEEPSPSPPMHQVERYPRSVPTNLHPPVGVNQATHHVALPPQPSSP